MIELVAGTTTAMPSPRTATPASTTPWVGAMAMITAPILPSTAEARISRASPTDVATKCPVNRPRNITRPSIAGP